MNKFRAWGPETPEETSLERANRQLAREVAQESIVLLKNEESVLPLTNKKVALYGPGARMTIRGGAGSGDMRERYSVNIEEGLENAGFTITSKTWLDRFDREYHTYVSQRKETIEEKVKDYTMENVLEMFEVIASVPLKYPTGSSIEVHEIPEDTATAIYVISRQAGEGHDRRVEPGDFLLSDVEMANISHLGNVFDQVVVLINCGAMVDITPLSDISAVKAIVYIGQGGTEGGNAVADILTGAKTPSGKLVDTWAKQYQDFPSYDTFSYMNGDLENEDYTEGIYVGYRYFETFDVEPLYPFGYGLSYTTFSHALKNYSIEGTQVTVKVEVKNTGSQYAGKEVIQLYVSKPGTRIETEKIALCSFAKTKLLEPNEISILTLGFDLKDIGVFDEAGALWLLEKGEYTLLIGKDARAVEVSLALDIEEDIILEKVDSIAPLNRVFEELSTQGKSTHVPAGDVPRLSVDAQAFTTVTYEYKDYTATPIAKVKEILPNLSTEDFVTLCVGAGQFDPLYNLTPGVAGSTTASLLDKGVPNITMSDGPAGLNVLTETVITPEGQQLYLKEIPASNNYGFIRDTAPFSVGIPESGRPIYQYMTAWPAVVNQAQTWNTSLIEEVGRRIGKEMVTIGAGLWLAPAINIHRNPLCGRNFEYYSEDPYLTGVMAAAVIRGVESLEGVGVTLKHFCCNNQEDNRDHVSSNLTERTLREIYVKAFKYVIQKEQPATVMSSYNRVNGVYTANSYDLLTKLLRTEFGFEGLVMTDWNAAAPDKASYERCQAAGNDLIMPGYQTVRDALLNGIQSNVISEEVIKRSAIKVLNMIFSNFTAERI